MLQESETGNLITLYTSCSDCLRSKSKEMELCSESCFALLNRALTSESDEPWTYFYLAFEPWVNSRVRSYCFRYRLSDTLVDHFVNITFFRYWRSLHGKPEKLTDYRHALNYLRVCARSTVLDSTKNSTQTSDQELDTDQMAAPPVRHDDFDRLWQIVLDEIENDRDRLLVHCYIVQDLKPRSILDEYAGIWEDTYEIKKEWQRVRRQMRRSYALRQWFGIADTI